MEKVKAHDRYKHICYWVVQLLYFDGIESEISTQVGLFDSLCICVLLILGFVHLQFAVYAQNQECGVNSAPDPLVVVLQSAVRNSESLLLSNDSTDFWEHTKGMLGLFFFFSNSEMKTVYIFVYWLLPQRTSL